MLEPQFFVSPAPVPDEVEFRLLGYARVAQYTLVRWRWGLKTAPATELTEGTYTDGESLWENDSVLVHAWQGVSLYQPEPNRISSTPLQSPSIWDQIDDRIGKFGIPSSVAMALQDSSNYVCFEAERAPSLPVNP